VFIRGLSRARGRPRHEGGLTRCLKIPTGFCLTAQGWRAGAYLGSSSHNLHQPQRDCGQCVTPLSYLASTTSRLPKRPQIPDQRWRLPPAPAVRHHCRTPHPIESFSPVGPASSRKRAIRYRSSTGPSFALGSACHHHRIVPPAEQMAKLPTPAVKPRRVIPQTPSPPAPTRPPMAPRAAFKSQRDYVSQPKVGAPAPTMGHHPTIFINPNGGMANALRLCLTLHPPPHASQNAPKFPTNVGASLQHQRCGIIVDYPTKMISLAP